MEAAKKKIRSLLIKTILTILVIIIVNYFWQKDYNALEKRYVIGEVIRIVPAWGQSPDVQFNFILESKKYVNNTPKGIFKPKVGEFYVVEVPIFRKKKSRILLDHPVSDSIKSPVGSWKEIPEYLKPK
ncbi:hypothetical protein [Belliella aquatica]|uniref:Uncharacterized protein n=1 Tax=Belliella aquatica TaxID=1323734 RepID=A0ABQ1MYN7_9BACT|nr:hypothetical protein [Belliella aquatica]MCH7406669.1 hypothetical protein [Belliella aquatica]GGC47573.1 hypothetical protein GCM10010993_27640 [Belliella aquatica]